MARTLSLIAVLALSACGQAPLEVAPVSVPASLLVCRDAPAKPAGDFTQRAVGGYIIDLHEAHADCRSKLTAVHDALTR